VGNIAALTEKIPARFVVVAFVQTQMLRGFVGGRSALNHYCVELGSKELEVRDVPSHRPCGGILLLLRRGEFLRQDVLGKLVNRGNPFGVLAQDS
jgi:hypothetical protein